MKKLFTFLLVTAIVGSYFTGPTPVYAASISTLTDDFDDNSVSANWSKQGVTSRVNEQNNRLEIVHSKAIEYNYLYTAVSYDFTGASASVQVVDPGNTGFTSQEAGMTFEVDGNNQFWTFIGNGVLKTYKLVAGVQTQVGTDTAFDPSVHKWLRIEESGGNLISKYSTDGTSWTTMQTLANPFGTATAKLRLYSQYWQAESAPNYAYFDNFNLTPTTCDPSTTLCFQAFTTTGYNGFIPSQNLTAYVACWGGGGGGGDGTNAGGGGGGGGAYASSTLSLTSGVNYTIFVGAGGASSTAAATAGSSGATTTFATTSIVASPGDGGRGASAADAAGGTGGRTALSTGTTKFAGGDGGIGRNTNDVGGGGGGGGGPNGAGAAGAAGNTVAGQGGTGGNGNNGTGNGTGGAGGNAAAGTDGNPSWLGGGGGGGGDDTFSGAYGQTFGGGGGGGEGSGANGAGSGGNGGCIMYYKAAATAAILQDDNWFFLFE